MAAGNGHEACVLALLEAGSNVDHYGHFYDGTSLMCAAQLGHEACVRVLLQAGADPANSVRMVTPR